MSTLSASEILERDYNMAQKVHWQKSSSDQSQQRPYLGVRVKDPVKELLKRKRKNVENTNTSSSNAMVLPHLSMTCYSQIGHPAFHETEVASSSVQHNEEETFHTTWLPQPSSAHLQPIPQWSSFPNYASHDAVNSSYMQDMSMPPACPSYTMMGPPSLMTYGSQPLLSNFGVNCQEEGELCLKFGHSCSSLPAFPRKGEMKMEPMEGREVFCNVLSCIYYLLLLLLILNRATFVPCCDASSKYTFDRVSVEVVVRHEACQSSLVF